MASSIHPDWSAPESVKGLFTTRIGGQSKPPYASFNLGLHVGDDPADVQANRELLALPGPPCWLNQTHSNRCVDLDAKPDENDADASITREKGTVLAVMVADCLPIFLADRAGKKIAVVHAGWRGLANNIISISVESLGSDGLLAWLGPCIGPCHYEVGQDVREQFGGTGFVQSGDKWLMDLPAIATEQLNSVGITEITGGDFCTFCDEERFFSHRRDGVTGRMAGFLWLEDG